MFGEESLDYLSARCSVGCHDARPIIVHKFFNLFVARNIRDGRHSTSNLCFPNIGVLWWEDINGLGEAILVMVFLFYWLS